VPHTLVDSNILLDVITEDPTWEEWSTAALARAADTGTLLINHVVYAEVGVDFADMADLDQILADVDCFRADLPWSAAFLAGKVYRDYRHRGGTKIAPPPDFFIGAHAAVMKIRLLTRDAARYRTYFPTVEVIAPE
jgi:predicted nucleic acid-binding protein